MKAKSIKLCKFFTSFILVFMAITLLGIDFPAEATVQMTLRELYEERNEGAKRAGKYDPLYDPLVSDEEKAILRAERDEYYAQQRAAYRQENRLRNIENGTYQPNYDTDIKDMTEQEYIEVQEKIRESCNNATTDFQKAKYENMLIIADCVRNDKDIVTAMSPLQYSNDEADISFTLPAGWEEADFNDTREFLTAKFVRIPNTAEMILFGFEDVWDEIPSEEKVGYSRSDINNDILFSVPDFAEYIGVSEQEITTVTYGDMKYFKYILPQSADYNVKVYCFSCLNNSIMYYFLYSASPFVDDNHFKNFESMMNSIKYSYGQNAENTFYKNDVSSKTVSSNKTVYSKNVQPEHSNNQTGNLSVIKLSYFFNIIGILLSFFAVAWIIYLWRNESRRSRKIVFTVLGIVLSGFLQNAPKIHITVNPNIDVTTYVALNLFFIVAFVILIISQKKTNISNASAKKSHLYPDTSITQHQFHHVHTDPDIDVSSLVTEHDHIDALTKLKLNEIFIDEQSALDYLKMDRCMIDTIINSNEYKKDKDLRQVMKIVLHYRGEKNDL